jgi:hypothetical protein
MTDLPHDPGFDPIRKSHREADSFNVAWWKNGEKLTWVQRIGFAVISLSFFSAGLIFGVNAMNYARDWNLLGAAGWSVPALLFIVPGILGLRSVLRF